VRALPLLLAACLTAPEPALPVLPEYATWYAETWTHCGATMRSRPAIPFAALTFHPLDANPDVLGRWEGTRIYLAPGVERSALVVQHEMLHAQLGTPGHPPVFARCDARHG